MISLLAKRYSPPVIMGFQYVAVLSCCLDLRYTVPLNDASLAI